MSFFDLANIFGQKYKTHFDLVLLLASVGKPDATNRSLAITNVLIFDKSLYSTLISLVHFSGIRGLPLDY